MAPTDVYPLSLHDALPIYVLGGAPADTRLVWAESIPAAPTLRPREIEAFRKAQLERARMALLEKAQPYLGDRKSTRLNSSHVKISYAVFCLKKKKRVACQA